MSDENSGIATASNTILLVVIALIAIPLAMMSLMFLFMGGVMGGMMGGFGGVQLFGLVPLAALVAVLYLGWKMTHAPTEHDESHAITENEIEELQRQYVEGELSEEEFEDRIDSELNGDTAVDFDGPAKEKERDSPR